MTATASKVNASMARHSLSVPTGGTTFSSQYFRSTLPLQGRGSRSDQLLRSCGYPARRFRITSRSERPGRKRFGPETKWTVQVSTAGRPEHRVERVASSPGRRGRRRGVDTSKRDTARSECGPDLTSHLVSADRHLAFQATPRVIEAFGHCAAGPSCTRLCLPALSVLVNPCHSSSVGRCHDLLLRAETVCSY